MSLVNDMLRDLEKRKASESTSTENAAVTRESMIEPRKSSFQKKDIGLAILLVIIVALLTYIFWPVEDAVIAVPENEKIEQPVKKDPEITEGVPADPVQRLKEDMASNTSVIKENIRQAQVKEVSADEVKPTKEVVKKQDKPKVTAKTKTQPQKVAKPKQEAKTKSKKEAEPTVSEAPKAKVKPKAIVDNSLPAKPAVDKEDKALNVALSPSALDLKTASDTISLFQLGRSEEAYTLAQTFVAETQISGKTKAVLANRLLNDQRFEELSTILESAGNTLAPDLRQVKARWLLIQGQLDQAITLLEEAQPSIDTQPEYYALLASLYQRNIQSGKAFEQYSQLIQTNDTVADWWAGLGIAADQMKQGRQALFAYQQAMSLPGLNRALEQYIGQRIAVLSRGK